MERNIDKEHVVFNMCFVRFIYMSLLTMCSIFIFVTKDLTSLRKSTIISVDIN